MTTATAQLGEQTWQALQADQEFASEVEPKAFPVFEELAKALPALLEDLLEQPLTLTNLTEAKLRFLRHAVEQHFPTKYLDALGDDAPMFMFGSDMEMLLLRLVDHLEEVVADVPAFLNQHSVSEESVMLGETVGLSSVNADAYKEGFLTVGQLIITQPNVIMKNS